MANIQGAVSILENHISQTLNGKICSELGRIIESRGDDIYEAILQGVFSKDYEKEIYNIYLESVLEVFDPKNHEVKILEGINKGFMKSKKDNQNITRKYKAMRDIEITKPPTIKLKSKALISNLLKVKADKIKFPPKTKQTTRKESNNESFSIATNLAQVASASIF